MKTRVSEICDSWTDAHALAVMLGFRRFVGVIGCNGQNKPKSTAANRGMPRQNEYSRLVYSCIDY